MQDSFALRLKQTNRETASQKSYQTILTQPKATCRSHIMYYSHNPMKNLIIASDLTNDAVSPA